MSKIVESKFAFKSFKRLKDGLGKFDAVVECNELAIRDLIKRLEESSNKDQLIKELSDNHNVKVNTVNVVVLSARVRQFYILSVMQQAEQFFDEFKREYNSYNNSKKWDQKQDGETDLENILRNIFDSKTRGIEKIGKEIYEGFDYYRRIRNRFSHSEERDSDKLDKTCVLLSSYAISYGSNFKSFNCPNLYNEISFDDFLLLTNIVKSIGYTFCCECKPSNETIVQKALSLLKIRKKGGKIIGFMKVKNDEEKIKRAIGNFLNSNFGIFDECDREEIINEILNAF